MRNTSCTRERGEQQLQKRVTKNDGIIDTDNCHKKRPENFLKEFTITGRFY